MLTSEHAPRTRTAKMGKLASSQMLQQMSLTPSAHVRCQQLRLLVLLGCHSFSLKMHMKMYRLWLSALQWVHIFCVRQSEGPSRHGREKSDVNELAAQYASATIRVSRA